MLRRLKSKDLVHHGDEGFQRRSGGNLPELIHNVSLDDSGSASVSSLKSLRIPASIKPAGI